MGNSKIILQVDGGGILGVTPALVLAELENRLKLHFANEDFLLRDVFSLLCGTSTGAIVTGLIGAGVKAGDIAKFYTDDGIRLFNTRNSSFITQFFKPRYKRDDFLKVLDRILKDDSRLKNSTQTLGEIPKSVAILTTAYNLCSHRTHFIKSSDSSDSYVQLRDAIAWSALSAAYYFGKIDAPIYEWIEMNNDTPPKVKQQKGALFQDGGQGTQNCTLDYVLTEILANQWGDDGGDVLIVSLGTGSSTKSTDYNSAKKISNFGEAAKFIFGEARDESTTIQEMASRYVESMRRNIKFFRLDYEAKEDYDLDDTEHFQNYIEGAKYIISSADFDNLVNSIKSLCA